MPFLTKRVLRTPVSNVFRSKFDSNFFYIIGEESTARSYYRYDSALRERNANVGIYGLSGKSQKVINHLSKRALEDMNTENACNEVILVCSYKGDPTRHWFDGDFQVIHVKSVIPLKAINIDIRHTELTIPFTFSIHTVGRPSPDIKKRLHRDIRESFEDVLYINGAVAELK